MTLVSDNLAPFFRIFIATGHYHSNLISPTWTKFKNSLVNLHRNWTRICNNHGFTGKQVFSVILIMIKYITNKRIYRLVIAKDSFHLSKLFFTFFNNISICIFSHNIIFLINQTQCLLIKLQFHNTTLIINWSCSTILYCLSHVIDINIISEYFSRISVFHRYRSTGKSNIGCIR